MTYMLGRMRNCTSYCLICDVKLEGTTLPPPCPWVPKEESGLSALVCSPPAGSGVKPVVCSNEQCVWRYEELGLGVKVTNELMLDEDVVDLLMSMLYSAWYPALRFIYLS